MYIVLQHETEPNDHGVSLHVTPLDTIVDDSGNGHRSNHEYLFCKEGVFWRYDCYHELSPYGWKREPGLCNKALTAGGELCLHSGTICPGFRVPGCACAGEE